MVPAMPNGERELFLADVHVGVLGVTDTRSRSAPLLVPVWYWYVPGGELRVQTGRETIKARLLRAAGRFSICVQDENPPYRYVSVEGPVISVTDPVEPTEREAMAYRYLDPEAARAYLMATSEQLVEDISFRMRPQHWRTANFAAFAAEFTEADSPT